MHYYLSFTCKTEGCNHSHIAAYLGKFEEGETLVTSYPKDFVFGCIHCGKRHKYTRNDFTVSPSLQRLEGFSPSF